MNLSSLSKREHLLFVSRGTHILNVLHRAIIKFPANSSNLYPWYNLTVYNSLRWGYDGWGGHISGPSLIHVTPKLNKSEAQASMQVAIDFAVAQGGSGIIDELPSWYAFFTKYVVTAEAV